MKTPLEHLIAELEELSKDAMLNQYTKVGISMSIFRAKSLLQEERNVMNDIWLDSTLQFANEAEMPNAKTFEQYFETKFNKDGKE